MRKLIAMWTFSKITMLIFLFALSATLFAFVNIFFSNLLSNQAKDLTLRVVEDVRFISHLRGQTQQVLFLPQTLGLASTELREAQSAYWFPQANYKYYLDFYVLEGGSGNPCGESMLFSSSAKTWPDLDVLAASSMCLPKHVKKIEFYNQTARKLSCFESCNYSVEQVDTYHRFLLMQTGAGILCIMGCERDVDKCGDFLDINCKGELE